MSKPILTILSSIIISFVLLLSPLASNAINTTSISMTNNVVTFAEMSYEVKESPTLENPVVDPNFNVMRNRSNNYLQSLSLVVVILIIAVLIPVLSSSIFSKKS